MVHYESSSVFDDCCGITYNQAVQALRSNDWDLWQAEVAIRSNKM
ncbi:Rac prophage protein [Escherichia coli]|uniref:Rac prophage protein n=1 Tax=Escherichia coli TaxID=562 RepID=A0A377E522_ECOLX|nr:Rac prophage protein [Escherichia coli]